MVKQRHQFFVVLLVCMDGLVVAIACLLAWLLRRWQVEGFAPRSWETYFKEPLVLFTVPISLYALWAFRLYRPRRDRSLATELADVLKASVGAMAGLVVVLWAVGNDTIRGVAPYGPAEIFGQEIAPGRLQLYTLAALLPLLLGAHRVVFRIVLRVIRRRGWNLRHVAIVGVGRLGQIVCRTLERNSWTGINIAYFVSHHASTNRHECMGLPVYGGLDDLERTLQEHRVDSVYVAIPAACGASVPHLLAQLDRFALDVKIVPDVQPRFMPESMVLTELDGMPVLSYRGSPHSALGGVGKRALDILGALAAMMLFSPIFLAVALAVRLTSPGPVIFKQKRVSVGGKVFKIYKFRTMYHVEDEQGPRVPGAPGWTERNDPRVTPVGRWLRKASLDELPQLLNVLKGQMSLVGPRPERPELIERFREDWRGYMLRQHVKAGMTGWAQVNGLRGQTSLKKRLQYDLFYVRHWSLWFDLRILWLTVFRGFVHKNAH